MSRSDDFFGRLRARAESCEGSVVTVLEYGDGPVDPATNAQSIPVLLALQSQGRAAEVVEGEWTVIWDEKFLRALTDADKLSTGPIALRPEVGTSFVLDSGCEWT